MLRSRRAMRIVHSSDCTAVFPLRLIVADLEIQPRIHTVCDTHILLDDVIDIRARLRMEACLFIVRIGELVPAAELIIVVVEAELIVAERYAAAALSIVAEARMHLIRAFLFRNDIDDAGDCLAAVKDRTAAFDDLNALDLARRNLIEIVLAAPCDRIAVHEYECTSLEAAHIDFVRHCTHRCSVRAKGFINKAIHLLKCIRCIRRTALLNILGRDDRRRCRHIDIPLLCTRRRHNDFAERICRQCLVITCPRMCGLRRIDLSRHRRKHDSSRKELLIPHLHRHYHSPLLKIIYQKLIQLKMEGLCPNASPPIISRIELEAPACSNRRLIHRTVARRGLDIDRFHRAVRCYEDLDRDRPFHIVVNQFLGIFRLCLRAQACLNALSRRSGCRAQPRAPIPAARSCTGSAPRSGRCGTTPRSALPAGCPERCSGARRTRCILHRPRLLFLLLRRLYGLILHDNVIHGGRRSSSGGGISSRAARIAARIIEHDINRRLVPCGRRDRKEAQCRCN